MHPILLVASAIVLAGAAMAGIGLAVRLQRKTREPLAALYLFYLVFAVLHGFFSKAAPILAETLLKPGTKDAARDAFFLFPYMSIPLAAAGALLFFTMMVVAVNRTPSLPFTTCFILTTGLAFLVQGVSIYNANNPGRLPFSMNDINMAPYWNTVMILMTAGGILYAVMMSGDLKNPRRKTLVRRFAFAQSVLLVARQGLAWLHPENEALVLLQQFVVFAGDLWPLLLLDRALPRMTDTASATLSQSLERFAITPREKEIVERICDGKTNNQIADELFISLQTVKTHTYRIYRKLGVRNRVQMINLLRHD